VGTLAGNKRFGLLGQVFLLKSPDAAIGVLLGVEFSSGPSWAATSLASDLANLDVVCATAMLTG
jgi:hypothetical protein